MQQMLLLKNTEDAGSLEHKVLLVSPLLGKSAFVVHSEDEPLRHFTHFPLSKEFSMVFQE